VRKGAFFLGTCIPVPSYFVISRICRYVGLLWTMVKSTTLVDLLSSKSYRTRTIILLFY